MNELSSVLNTQFSGTLNLAIVKLITLFICSLCKVQTVTFNKLANAFDYSAGPDSSLMRIQRFIADFSFDSGLIAQLIFGLSPNKNKELILSTNITN